VNQCAAWLIRRVGTDAHETAGQTVGNRPGYRKGKGGAFKLDRRIIAVAVGVRAFDDLRFGLGDDLD